MSKENATAAFEERFKSSTGVNWDNGNGQRKKWKFGEFCPIVFKNDDVMLDNPCSWEYCQDEGSAEPSWHLYSSEAIKMLEALYQQWKDNPSAGLDIR